MAITFAYGSNLCRSRLLSRCPHAVDRGEVVLAGYRLVFYGAADLEPDKTCSVSCVAWELTPEDEATLDRCEGVFKSTPSYQKREAFAVNSDGTELKGVIYVMTDFRRMRDPRTPSVEYFNMVAQGYDERRFNQSDLKRALEETRGI